MTRSASYPIGRHPIIIATAQCEITADLNQNAENIERLLRRAAGEGADIIHFPEGALSGQAKSEIKAWDSFDWELLNAQLDKIGRICHELGIWAVIGSAHNACDDGRPYNSLYVFDNLGQRTARYDKRFCSHSEITDWYRAGNTPLTIDINNIKFGFAICIEIQFPELFLAYEKLHVDCVLLSAYSDSHMFAIQAQGHAACNNFWVSYSVPSHISHKQSSCMIGPDGKIIENCKNGRPDIIIHKIDPDALEWDIPCKKARPWRRKARLGDIYRDT